MSIADELHALHDKLFREERILRSEEDVLARAVEALRATEKCKAWLRLEVDAACRSGQWHRHLDASTALALLNGRPSAAERSGDAEA